ncbi:MAG: hypothetical protein HOO06_08130 [Bdellovibrionaceae bacterium]|jgi:hypothetical protein|nr:hypothetical protein [Pseudobdellovibrionaceae bacterium]
MKIIFLIISLVAIGTLTSCGASDATKIFEAQHCIDTLDESVSNARLITSSENCEAKINGVNSSQADIIRCSARFIGGGVTTERITGAFDNNDSQGAASQSNLISLLTFITYDTGAENVAKAKAAASVCESSGQKGLIFLASLSKIGTLVTMSSGLPTCATTGDNICDADELATDGGGGLTACQTDSSNCDPAEVGNTAILLSETYCIADNTDDPFCQQVQAAVAAGGDSSTIGDALLDGMN